MSRNHDVKGWSAACIPVRSSTREYHGRSRAVGLPGSFSLQVLTLHVTADVCHAGTAVRGHARAEGHLKATEPIHPIVGRQQVTIWVPVMILNIFITVLL
jgi:hypothetical protein